VWVAFLELHVTFVFGVFERFVAVVLEELRGLHLFSRGVLIAFFIKHVAFVFEDSAR
jgi:hypothetical protein